MSLIKIEQLRSTLAFAMVASNFMSCKTNAVPPKKSIRSITNRGKQAAANGENLIFEGRIATTEQIKVCLDYTVKVLQHVFDCAKSKNITLAKNPEEMGLGKNFRDKKFDYNELLEFFEIKEGTKKILFGCATVSAHLMKSLTKYYFINAQVQCVLMNSGEVDEPHSIVILPCTDGHFYALEVLSKGGKFRGCMTELSEYAGKHMAYTFVTDVAGCYSVSVGFYIRSLLNKIIKNRQNLNYNGIVESLKKKINDIDQKGDFLLQPYINFANANEKEFECKPNKLVNCSMCCFYLIGDNDKIGDFSKYDVDMYDILTEQGTFVLSSKKECQIFLKLYELFPNSKILIYCPDSAYPEIGDKAFKLNLKDREAIKDFKADGKIFQKVLSVKEFLDIESKYNEHLREALKEDKFRHEALKYINNFRNGYNLEELK